MPKSLEKVCALTGKTLTFFEIDICDKNGLRKVFNQNTIDCVIHIAALKSVNEVTIICFFKAYLRQVIGKQFSSRRFSI